MSAGPSSGAGRSAVSRDSRCTCCRRCLLRRWTRQSKRSPRQVRPRSVRCSPTARCHDPTHRASCIASSGGGPSRAKPRSSRGGRRPRRCTAILPLREALDGLPPGTPHPARASSGATRRRSCVPCRAFPPMSGLVIGPEGGLDPADLSLLADAGAVRSSRLAHAAEPARGGGGDIAAARRRRRPRLRRPRRRPS